MCLGRWKKGRILQATADKRRGVFSCPNRFQQSKNKQEEKGGMVINSYMVLAFQKHHAMVHLQSHSTLRRQFHIWTVLPDASVGQILWIGLTQISVLGWRQNCALGQQVFSPSLSLEKLPCLSQKVFIAGVMQWPLLHICWNWTIT